MIAMLVVAVGWFALGLVVGLAFRAEPGDVCVVCAAEVAESEATARRYSVPGRCELAVIDGGRDTAA